MTIPASLQRLVEELARLPGIGQKTAQRLAFGILRDEEPQARALAEAILAVKRTIRFCEQCFSYAEDTLCPICTDGSRDPRVVCVVEQPDNVYIIERSTVFRGRYHVLLGTISPLDGIGPEDLKIGELEARLQSGEVEELILAMNPSMPGEATALQINRLFEGRVRRITRLARGLPMGASLDFTDDVTLHQAFAGRQTYLS